MKKAIAIVMTLTIGLPLLTGCTQQQIPTSIETSSPTTTQKSNVDKSEVIASIYKDLYIGEALKSGFVYIEPFTIDRSSLNSEITFSNYPDSIEFYALDSSNSVYKCNFDSISDVYIPSIEEGSKYYGQGFSQPPQYALRYKTDAKIDSSIVGISLLNHKVSQIDFSCNGKKRTYSEAEYAEALQTIEKKKQDNLIFQSAFREATIEDTIVGAEQICLINIADTDIKVLLSKYFSLGFESTSDVYVIDFIDDNGEVIKTYRKTNSVTY